MIPIEPPAGFCWCGLHWLPVGIDAITENGETHAANACARKRETL